MKTDEAGIVISGRSWSASDFVRADGTPGPWTSKALEADPLSFEAELGRFLTELFSPGAAVTVHTSGSTGAPKAFAAEKSRMRASARATRRRHEAGSQQAYRSTERAAWSPLSVLPDSRRQAAPLMSPATCAPNCKINHNVRFGAGAAISRRVNACYSRPVVLFLAALAPVGGV